MADISTLAERFATNVRQDRQPINEMINARLQRIQELERVRLEHASEHTTNAGDGDSRHSRRDRFIRQTGQRSTERQGFGSSIQRTPLRSQSFENATLIADMDEDTQSFRNMFESSRQTLFGPRASGSTENLNGRRTSETSLTAPRAVFQTGSESGSGSNTPRGSLSVRPANDFTASLAEAFSNIRSAMVRSDSSSSLRETRRSSSITRESNSSSNLQRFAVTNNNGTGLTRSSSVRETRRESRFRRRTIQGVDSNISRALEQERAERSSPSASRSISPLVVDTALTSAPGLYGTTTVTQSRESSRTTSSFSSTSSAYSIRHPKKIDLYPEEGIAVLGFEKDKEIFVDNNGKVYWLKKSHALLREVKRSNQVPEIVFQSLRSEDNSEGFVASIEGNMDARYSKLRELVKLSRMRDGQLVNSDFTDSAKALCELEWHKKDDSYETIDIDEKFKSFSLYTEPRPRQDIEKLISMKEVLPIYHGIPRSELPQEIKDRDKDQSEKDLGYRTFENYNFDFIRTEINGAATRTQQTRSERSHEQISSESADGTSASYTGTGERHEAIETHSDESGNVSSRQDQFQSQTQQAEIRNSDGVSNIFQRRAEARRQQYLSTTGGSVDTGMSVIQRRAEERRQQYLAEQQRNENGTTVSSTRSESVQQQFSSETRTSQNGSAVQSQSEERHQQYFTSQTNTSDSNNTSVRHEESSRTIRQTSSQSNIVRQSSQSYVDNSDIHSEVNLVMERLHLMQDNPSEPLDASHLDYEEMLMIQKALADNPSPPYSPVALETDNTNTEEVISVSDEHSNQNKEEDSSHFKTIEKSPTDANVAEDAAISSSNNTTAGEMMIVKSGSDIVIDSNFGSEATDSRSSFISATQSVITHTKVIDDEETFKENNVITNVDSIQDLSLEKTAEETVTETSIAKSTIKDGVIESRTPRYQRLPSEGGEGRLPLPSMDWSPLERSNSPLSPSRFSFEDKKSENTSSASSTVSNSGASSKFTVPKTSKSSPETSVKSSVQSELTIEIPSYIPVTSPAHSQSEASSAGTQNLTNQNYSYKDTATLQASPLVKSPGASVSGSSEAPSPAGSETVTTVFEEFIQTVPYSVILKMRAAEEEDSD